jgi:ribosome-binding factor A
MTRRTDRVGDLLRAELAELMAREVNDPRARSAAYGCSTAMAVP